jgi:hypothetical protein
VTVSASTQPQNPNPTRSPKKVQFNSAQEAVVCGGLSSDDFDEEDEEKGEETGAEREDESPHHNADAEPVHVEITSGKDSGSGSAAPVEEEEEEVAEVSRVKVKTKNLSGTGTSPRSSTEVNNLGNDSKRQQLNQNLRQLSAEASMRKNLKPTPTTQPTQPEQEEKAFQGNTPTAPPDNATPASTKGKVQAQEMMAVPGRAKGKL